MYGICEAIDGEKDPQCLLPVFRIVECLAQLYPDPSGPLANYAEDLFEILGSYFPIRFTHVRDLFTLILFHTPCHICHIYADEFCGIMFYISLNDQSER